MKLSDKVKLLEERIIKQSKKLPKHNREKYFWARLPEKLTHNKSDIAFSLQANITKLVQRYAKLYDLDWEGQQYGVGNVEQRTDAIKLEIKVFLSKKRKIQKRQNYTNVKRGMEN